MDKNENRRTYLKVFINLGIMLVLLLFFIFVAPRVIIYFMPFVVGWIIAMIASPLVGFFEKKVKIKRKAGSAFVIITVIGLVIFAGYFVCAKLMEQVIEFAGELPDMWEGTQQEFAQIGERLEAASKYLPDEIEVAIVKITSNIGEYLGELFGRLGSPAIETLSRFTMNLPSILIGIIMCLLSAYFFVADKDYLSNLLHKVMTQSMLAQINLVKRGLVRAVGGYFKAQLKIEFWMYLLLVLGFTILRVKYAFLIAIGVAFLDLLPFFGTGTVLIPWAIIKFLNGEYTMVIGLLIIWGVGQLARQLIQPRIVGDSVGLEPIPTLFLLFIGYKSAGVVGMIIAVPIGIIVLTMYEEGVFDTTIDSMKVLYASISNFRHLNDEDMKAVQIYRDRKSLKGKDKEMLEDESNSL